MICVVILKINDSIVEVDTWLMSCRVLERGVEKAVLNEIMQVAEAAGASSVIGTYVPTLRNEMVRDHYERLGFTLIASSGQDGGGTRWQMNVHEFGPHMVHMAIKRNTPI